MTSPVRRMVCLVLLTIPTGMVAGQADHPVAAAPTPGVLEVRCARASEPACGLFESVYALDGPAWNALFGAADAGALPISFGAPAALAAARWAEGEGRYADAWRAGLSVMIGFGLSSTIKRVVKRERPFLVVPGVTAKTRFAGARHLDRYSFPSSHAAMAAALATSLALSHPEWYVVAPAAAWAGAVGVSRVWLGVHFPGDVLAGWALGATVAWTVHRLGDRVTPKGLRGPTPTAAPPILTLRF